MKCNIYKITNKINGKRYVGKTTYKLNYRFNQHVSDAYEYTYNSALHAAIRKYGKDAFEIKLIEECDNDISSERETYWIKHYDTYKNGYNSTLGGDGKPTLEVPSKEELLEKVKSGWSIRQMTKHYKVYDKTIKLWLDKYDIQYKSQELLPIKVGCVINNNEMEFNSLTEAGKFLINNRYTDAIEPAKVGVNIRRSIDRHGTYLGIKWYFI